MALCRVLSRNQVQKEEDRRWAHVSLAAEVAWETMSFEQRWMRIFNSFMIET